ncbi:MAG: ECF RNA polymerase sigma factor SigE [Bacteroidetes bacterium ADurb.Bin037]|nr:MAG: ECF RNA polymerase sigma factor SigE [Bacteroidetes bacterium ADurb.Bin037]HPW78487.1 RNA polymerase sigma-70 factor [Bacteroidales bacterium]HQB55885.1 RNA polymerase sigma-70 factor [Bacteroidales bacterium]
MLFGTKDKEQILKESFLNYSPRLINYAMRFVSSRDIAQDIVQDCFMRFWERIDKFEFLAVKPLLFTMVRNACLNHLKHLNVVKLQRLKYIHDDMGEERVYHYDFDMEPNTSILYEELEKQIQIVVDKLPKRCRQVFLLSRFEGLKNKDIASRLDISLTAVEKHIRRALMAFNAHFEKNGPLSAVLL